MTIIRQNTAEGGSDGVAATGGVGGNTGGASGDFMSQIITAVEFDTAEFMEGALSYKITNTIASGHGAGPGWDGGQAPFGSGHTEGWLRYYIKFSGSVPVTDIQNFINGSGSSGGIRTDSSGHLLILDRTSATVDTGTYVMSAGVWYRIESRCINDATTGEMEAKLYQGHSLTELDALLATGINTGPDGFLQGVNLGLGVRATLLVDASCWIDDIAGGDAWIGPSGSDGAPAASPIPKPWIRQPQE